MLQTIHVLNSSSHPDPLPDFLEVEADTFF